MAGELQSGVKALVMHERDHVATALEELKAGEIIEFRIGEQLESLKLLDPIPFGHKLAIRDIAPGTEVRKYGEIIGRSTQAAPCGGHVHTHNLEGIRGRGDQAKKAGIS